MSAPENPRGPEKGKSAAAWSESAEHRADHPPTDAELGVFRGCLTALLILCIIIAALLAIGLSGGVETVGAIQ